MASSSNAKLFVTGATGNLGGLVIASLIRRVAAGRIVAGARSLDDKGVADLRALGVEVRQADYTQKDTLASAFAGIERLLLISSSDAGQRVTEHQNVIDAAEAADIRLFAYTSLLHADTSPLPIAADHRATEAALARSSLPVVLLRNAWYTENYAGSIAPALQHGAFLGSAGNGRISSAARADLAEAAAIILIGDDQAGRVYELSGDESFTLAEFAATVAEEAGTSLVYKDLPEEDYKAVLLKSGMPEELADLLAGSDAGAERGGLYDEGRGLGKVIGRPTTPFRKIIREALASQS